MGQYIGCDFERQTVCECQWVVNYAGRGSDWERFVRQHYGGTVSDTGVSPGHALPQLLRRTMNSWNVSGLAVYLGRDFISFGPMLSSRRYPGLDNFYGTDILFTNSAPFVLDARTRSRIWQLRLHKAILDTEPPVVALSSTSSIGSQNSLSSVYRLGDGSPQEVTNETFLSETAMRPYSGSGHRLGDDSARPTMEQSGNEANIVELQLFLSNSQGHPGCLRVPLTQAKIPEVQKVLDCWAVKWERPLTWAGNRFEAAEDFSRLHGQAFLCMDLLLLGMSPAAALMLTPDGTWEQYPLGRSKPLPPSDNGDDEGTLALTN